MWETAIFSAIATPFSTLVESVKSLGKDTEAFLMDIEEAKQLYQSDPAPKSSYWDSHSSGAAAVLGAVDTEWHLTTHLPENPIDAFNQLFVMSSEQSLQQTIVGGALRGSCIRSICWKVFLGCVPQSCSISAWPEYLLQQRKGYEQLRNKHQAQSKAEAERYGVFQHHVLEYNSQLTFRNNDEQMVFVGSLRR